MIRIKTKPKSNKVAVAESAVEAKCVPYELLGYTGLSKHPHLYIPTHTHQATTYSRADIDSHADTSAFGDGALIYEKTEQRVNVHPYSSDMGPRTDVPIGTAAVAYDCQATYQTYILFFPQSLLIEGMDRHLIHPRLWDDSQHPHTAVFTVSV